MNEGRVLERVTVTAPFGFRAWDPVERRPVRHGIQVICRWAGGRPVALPINAAGVVSGLGVPELRTFAQGVGDAAFWADPPDLPGTGVIVIRDSLGRFLPVSLTVEGVARVGRLAREICGLPGVPPWQLPAEDGALTERSMPTVPLLSAPTREVPSGMAAVRARVLTLDERPAAGAVVVVTVPGAPPAMGVTDRRGEVLVCLPMPAPGDAPAPDDGPPVAPDGPLAAQTWPGVRIRVHHLDLVSDEPGPPTDPATGRPSAETAPLADLCALLGQLDQPPVLALGATPGTPLDDAAQVLVFGRPLIVRTDGHHALLIDPSSPHPG